MNLTIPGSQNKSQNATNHLESHDWVDHVQSAIISYLFEEEKLEESTLPCEDAAEVAGA